MIASILSFWSTHFALMKIEFWYLVVSGITTGFLYGMVAVGYTMVYGILRLINFAHSEIFMTGAFAGYFLMREFVGNNTPSGVQSILLILGGIAVGALASSLMAAFVLERVAYRPLRKRKAPPLAYLISAIGASYFLQNLAGKEFGRNPIAVPQPYGNANVFTVFGAPFNQYDLLVVIAGILSLVALDIIVGRTKLGRSLRAVAQDMETASLMGVDIDRTIMFTFLIGGAMAGAAGFLWGLNSNVGSTMGFVPGIKAFTSAVLGGIGNLRGAMLGGMILGIVENLAQPFVSSAYIDVVAFAILVGLLMFRPTGILGERLGRVA